MLVQVRLFATFREGRFSEKQMDLPDGTTMAQLLDQLEIPAKEARILLVNGDAVSADYKFSPDDIIAIFPPLAGG